MKVFLDDERPTRDGWPAARWPEDLIDLLMLGGVTHVSLNHDLGDAEAGAREARAERTGYEALVCLEEQVFGDRDHPVPESTIRPANTPGRERMMRAIAFSERLRQRQTD
jgi:hypothetical protein